MAETLQVGHRDSWWDKNSQSSLLAMLIGGRVLLGDRADILWLERQDILGDQAFALDRGCLWPTDPSLFQLTFEDLPPYRHGR
jgi:hypothetical protein